MLTQILILIALIGGSAFFSAAETALFSVDMLRIHTRARSGDPTAKLIERLRSDPRLLLGAILLGNNAVNIGAGAMATVITMRAFGDAAIGIMTGIMTLVMLIFGEFIPKAFAAHSAERAAGFFAYPINFLWIVFKPIIRILGRLVELITPFEDSDANPAVSEEEIKTLARLGVKAGTIEKEESELIERVLLFSDITAEDVMTPAEKMVMLDGAKTVGDVVKVFAEEGFSRYPVWEGSPSKIVGVVHVRDVFERMAGDPARVMQEVRVKDIAEPAMHVPETMPLDDLLRSFQKQHTHMALVVNEYGSIEGLVTIEDLLEELVGEISDETDVDTHVIKRVDKHTVIVHGDTQVTDIDRFLNTRIGGAPNRTVSRIILEKLGKMPEQGQTVALADDLSAEILVTTDLRIERVRLVKRPKDGGAV
jgi:putative hemolysin